MVFKVTHFLKSESPGALAVNALLQSVPSCSPDHNTEHTVRFFWRLAFFMAFSAMVVASLKTFSMFSRYFAEHSR